MIVVVVTAAVAVDLVLVIVAVVTAEVGLVHTEAEAEVVVREADPDHFPDQDHVQEAWIVVAAIEGLEVEVAMTVERITNRDLDSVMVAAVDVEGTEISEIIVIFAITVDVAETEDGWAMVAAVAVVVEVRVVVVFEVVNEDSTDDREAGLMTVWIVNAVRTIGIRVPLTMRKIRATERVHHRPAQMLKELGRKVPK